MYGNFHGPRDLIRTRFHCIKIHLLHFIMERHIFIIHFNYLIKMIYKHKLYHTKWILMKMYLVKKCYACIFLCKLCMHTTMHAQFSVIYNKTNYGPFSPKLITQPAIINKKPKWENQLSFLIVQRLLNIMACST